MAYKKTVKNCGIISIKTGTNAINMNIIEKQNVDPRTSQDTDDKGKGYGQTRLIITR